ncbi:MAG: DUF4031 domain-containing protein [Mesorhizobium sp.]
MAVYVDDPIWPHAGRLWCHMLADSEDELHAFAARLGLKRSSYQGPPVTKNPHYDLTAFERNRALRIGAVAVTRHEIVQILRRLRAEAAERG